MSETGFVLLLAGCMFSLRIAGTFLNQLRLPEPWEAAWRYLPVALLSALIVTGVNDGLTIISGSGIIAVGVAGVAFYYSRRMWVGIGSGLVVFWIVQSAWL